jgi:hypothetical protein
LKKNSNLERNIYWSPNLQIWIISLKYQTLPNLKVWTPNLTFFKEKTFASKPFPTTTLDEVAGCLAYQGEPKTLEDMERELAEGLLNIHF